MNAYSITISACIATLAALMTAACVPTVNQPLLVGKAADDADLAAFAGTWQVSSDDETMTVQAMVETYDNKQALRFIMIEEGLKTDRYLANVRKLSATNYVLNFDTRAMQFTYKENIPYTRQGEARYVVVMASFSGQKLIINPMKEAAVRADIKSGAYSAGAWNMCTKSALTAKNAILGGKSFSPPAWCVQLTPTRAAFLDYITRRAQVIYDPQVALVLSRK